MTLTVQMKAGPAHLQTIRGWGDEGMDGVCLERREREWIRVL